MVALQKHTNGSSNDDVVELLHDVRYQPNADPEAISMLLQSIELATATSIKNPSNSVSRSKTISTASVSYAAVLAPATAAKSVPVDETKGASIVELRPTASRLKMEFSRRDV